MGKTVMLAFSRQLSRKYVIKSKRQPPTTKAKYRAYHRKWFDDQQFKSPNKKVA
jgi:hypothetical protein